MPFKNPRTGTYQMERTLPGYGRLPRISLGTKRRADAEALERAVLEVHRRGLQSPGLFAVLDALKPVGRGKRGRVTPEEILVSVRAVDGTEAGLARLLRQLDNPPLADVVAEVVGLDNATREDKLAGPSLLKYARLAHGPEPGVSVLMEPGAIEALLLSIEAGEKKGRNAIVRYERTLISKLLSHRYGRAERNRLMAPVRFSGSDDRRRLIESVVTPAAIVQLCDELAAGYWSEGDEAAPVYARLAVTTGATIRPLSESLNRALDPDAGTLFLANTKKSKGRRRDRALVLPPQLIESVVAFHRPEAPDARLFPLVYTRFATLWKKAVKRAGLSEAVLNGSGQRTPLRPHDLRGVFAAFAERSGLERTKISTAGLGHTRLDMTDHYLLRETSLSAEEAGRLAELLT